MDARRRRLLCEARRFAAVGGVATVVSLVVFNGLVHGLLLPGAPLGDRPILAYVLATGVGMVVSYHGSRTYAFRDRPTRHVDGGRTAFVVINLLTMTIPIACLAVSRDVLGLRAVWSDNLAANGIGLLLGQVARFLLFRRFVFQPPVRQDARPEARQNARQDARQDASAAGPLSPGRRRSRLLAGRPTAPSTSDPAEPGAPGAAAG